ncbi:type II secretion system F family protein [Sphingomicrobium lutaoense]|uniref:Tight adherence protein B n=1 Tax=Sphingomicrobium lutaoense TaxID=515949 RepID=A0A839Z2W5_9SPHN|nr:type II secretion system F family protein [Sphingomicrobium lutaoense]MBB3763962.1 tight adherence protein B [Sphingomicrobium lutaoense]
MLLFIIFAGIIALVATAWVVINGSSPQKTYKRRMESMLQRHAEGGALKASAQLQIRKLMAERQSKMDGFASSLMPRPALMKQRLQQTGKDISLSKYMTATLGLFAVATLGLWLRGAPIYFAAAAGLAFGVGVPHFVIGRLIKKRMVQFNNNFPDAIELMVRGLRSGLPITETLGIVASEIPGPVGLEFKEVAEKMKIGRTMESALQDTADRLGTPEFQFFVITLAIQRETGGNLAETLSNLADVLRKRMQMKLKIRAMSSESKASAMIVGALPFIVFALVYMMNPGYMAGFFSDERLMVAGIGGLVWMSIGVFMMAKMVNFEI